MSSYSFYGLEPPVVSIPNGFTVETPNNFDLRAMLPPRKRIPVQPLNPKICSFSVDPKPTNSEQKAEDVNSKSYELLDQKTRRFTQNMNLREKIDLFMSRFKEREANAEREELKKEAKIEGNGNLAEKEGGSDEEDLIDSKENRYFNKNPQFFCFRCRKPGHFVKTCPEEVEERPPKCLICLDPSHLMSRCESFICYKCLKTGHMARDCAISSHSMGSCYRCNKRGHKAKECGVLASVSEEIEKRVKCLNCGKPGHVNCKQIEGLRDGVYQGEATKKSRKRRVWEDERIKTNLEYFEEEGKERVGKKGKKIRKKRKAGNSSKNKKRKKMRS